MGLSVSGSLAIHQLLLFSPSLLLLQQLLVQWVWPIEYLLKLLLTLAVQSEHPLSSRNVGVLVSEVQVFVNNSACNRERHDRLSSATQLG